MPGGLVAEWYRADGAAVQPGDPVCRIECAFVAFEVEANHAGLLRHRRPVGSFELPGVVLGHILGPGESPPAEENTPMARPHADSVPQPADYAEPGLEGEPEFEFEGEVETRLARRQSPPPLVVLESPAFLSYGDELETEVGTLEEFETPLAGAVVVPFPGRFAMQPGTPIDEAPEEAATFDPSVFELAEHEVVPSLPEPGGTIPGLALWETEEQLALAEAFGTPATTTTARIASVAAASAQILVISIALDATEAERMRTVLTREWRHAGMVPLFEDIAFRAIAIALSEHFGGGSTGALLIADVSSDVSSASFEPAAKSFRAAVKTREHGGDADFDRADWLLVSLARHGIAAASPRLDPGHDIAFAIGAVAHDGCATLTAAYDSSQWSEGSAARLLARTREIFEAPYAMLV